MRMREVLVVAVTAAAAISGIVTPGLAESKESIINHSKMKRDIRIMENILEELLSSGQKALFSLDQQVRGLYLEDYGVIFYVPRRWSVPHLWLQPAMEGTMEGLHKGLEEFQKGTEQWMPELQRQMEELQKELDTQLPEIGRQIEEGKHQSADSDDKQNREQVEELQERVQEVQRQVEKAHTQKVEVQEQTEEIRRRTAEIRKQGEEIRKQKEGMQRHSENLKRHEENLRRHRQELRIHGDELRDLKADLTEFLGSYADTIRQLEPADWISVIVDMDGEYLNASATKRAISEFRKTDGDVQAFAKRIAFTPLAAQEDIDRALRILSGVFETALKQTYPAGGIRVERAYLDSVGALLFIDASVEASPVFPGTPWDSGPTRSTGALNRKRRVERIKAELVELLKEYGQGLGVLKPGDAVTIAVDLGRSDEGPETVVLKARKGDIEAANRERIGLEEFRQRVKICEY